MKEISDFCKQAKLRLHLDGARLFNVLVETGDHTREIGPLFNSISICLSKGLGAPAGSVLIGPKSFIAKARKFRKVMGGGMRQSGYLAAAGIYALENNIDRLAEDNMRAKVLGAALSSLSYVETVRPVHTNIVIFDLAERVNPDSFLDYIRQKGINPHYLGKQSVRFVTHLDLSQDMIDRTIEILKSYKSD
jgi:threonine aldolase